MTEPNHKLLQELEELTAITWTLTTAMESEEADRAYRLTLQHITQCLKGICKELKPDSG